MSEEKKEQVHNLIVEQCKKVNMSGVREVKTFDEETVLLDTAKGLLTIKGEDLLINGFSNSTGELVMEGKVYAFIYSGNDSSRGFFKRLLK